MKTATKTKWYSSQAKLWALSLLLLCVSLGFTTASRISRERRCQEVCAQDKQFNAEMLKLQTDIDQTGEKITALKASGQWTSADIERLKKEVALIEARRIEIGRRLNANELSPQ